MTEAPTASLEVHPLLWSFPAIEDKSPEVQVLVKAVGDLGRILEPLKVNRGRIVDGRVRHLAARIHGMENVPVDEVDDSEVATIALQSLLARKHLTTGARTYLTEPLIEPALTETRKRAVENARKVVSNSKSESRHGTFVNSVEDLVEQYGISRTEFFRARAIRKKFAANPELRAEWEPKILSGEMGLERVQQAIAGKIAAIEGRTTPKNDAYQLTLDLFSTAAVRLERWKKLSPTEQDNAEQKYVEEWLKNLPERLLKTTEKYLRERRTTAVVELAEA